MLEAVRAAPSSRGCARDAGPDRQPVRERRHRAQARRRPGGAPGRNRDRPDAGARRGDRARGRMVAPRRGDLRLLGRRHLQRGDQRASAPTSRSGSSRAAGRACCRARSGFRAIRPAPPSASRIGTPRRISLGRLNGRRFAFSAGHRVRCRARPPRRRDRAPRGRQAAGRPRLQPGPSCRTLADHRLRYEPALEVEGLGRAAFALDRELLALHLCRARSGCGSRPTRPSKEGWTSSRRSRCAARGPAARRRRRSAGARGGDVLLGHDLDRILIRCDRRCRRRSTARTSATSRRRRSSRSATR